jgi:agmatinase
VRSISREEYDTKPIVKYVDAYQIDSEGFENIVQRAISMIKTDRIYLSLDIDGIDPAYAPGTGTPEPFGLTPIQIKKLIRLIGPRLVGFDVVEVAPDYDNGNTSALAARIVREVIATVYKSHSCI